MTTKKGAKAPFLFLSKLFDSGNLGRGSEQLSLGFGDVEITLLIGERVFGSFLGLDRSRFVQIISADSSIRKYRNQVWLNFEYATGNEEKLFLAIAHVKTHFAWLQR